MGHGLEGIGGDAQNAVAKNKSGETVEGLEASRGIGGGMRDKRTVGAVLNIVVQVPNIVAVLECVLLDSVDMCAQGKGVEVGCVGESVRVDGLYAVAHD